MAHSRQIGEIDTVLSGFSRRAADLGPAALAQFACILEVLARKAGNVHPGSAFADATIVDFLLSAQAIAPALGRATELGLGATVLAATQATQLVTATNTNLGILLLLTPLVLASTVSSSPSPAQLRTGTTTILAQTTVADSEAVYAAIRLVAPGGLGTAKEQDVRELPTLPLTEIMRLAADRDLVARQYASGFAEVFDIGHAGLSEALAAGQALEDAILTMQLRLISELGESLIRRKVGPAIEEEARRRAAAVLDSGWPQEPRSKPAFLDFDAWLRADGHCRNPGAVADLVTASLFVALRSGTIPLPMRLPWTSTRL